MRTQDQHTLQTRQLLNGYTSTVLKSWTTDGLIPSTFLAKVDERHFDTPKILEKVIDRNFAKPWQKLSGTSNKSCIKPDASCLTFYMNGYHGIVVLGLKFENGSSLFDVMQPDYVLDIRIPISDYYKIDGSVFSHWLVDFSQINFKVYIDGSIIKQYSDSVAQLVKEYLWLDPDAKDVWLSRPKNEQYFALGEWLATKDLTA